MPILEAPAAALSFLGRQGTRAVALSVFAGLFLPGLAALFRPYFTAAILVLLCLAFLRVEPAALRGHFRRPGLVLAASAWMMLATPALFALGAFMLTGTPKDEPLFLALALQVMAPPVTASPALAALMGLDAALSLATLIVCTAAIPFTAPLFVFLLYGTSLALSPLALGLRLFALLGGAALAATLIRRFCGRAFIARQAERIDGLNVIALFVFAVAVMDGVAAQIMQAPLLALGFFALVFAVALLLASLTALVLLRAGAHASLAIALAAGSRNMGLMLAAIGSVVPERTWLYFAIAQFPIYLLPHILKPLGRWGRKAGA
jgi:hypothetical protein